MKTKVKQNTGFRPVQIKLDFDNPVEYAVFTQIVSLNTTIPNAIVDDHVNSIMHRSGVKVEPEDLRQCAKAILDRIYNRLPKGNIQGGMQWLTKAR